MLGKKTGGGSRKGKPNKVAKDLRAMIISSLTRVGGEGYLIEQSRINPTAYLTLVGKVLPKDVIVDATIRFERIVIESVRA